MTSPGFRSQDAIIWLEDKQICYKKYHFKNLSCKGIQQTLQKNSVGFIPLDGISVGKDRIPWEKDRQSVLFYAPAPKTHGNFTVFLLTLYKKNQVTVMKGDNKRRKKSTTEIKDEQKLPEKG